MDARFPQEADYADPPTIWTGCFEWLLAGDTLSSALCALMLSGCCIVAPPALVLAGLGLLVCHSPEARHNAAFLLTLGGIYAALASSFFIGARFG